MSHRRGLVARLRGLLRGDEAADTIVGGAMDCPPPARRHVASAAGACGVTDVGCIRDRNEDAFHVADDGRLLIVADGMGGHLAGEVASAVAVETLRQHLGQHAGAADDPSVATLLLDAFKAAHARILAIVAARPECRGMGTTLIAAIVRDARLHVCHVGDVRGYVFRDGTLRHVTQDHSVVGTLVRAGELAPDAARVHPRRNEILQAVGLEPGIEPGIAAVDLDPGDRVVLCSDGLWEMVDDADLAMVLAGGGPVEARVNRLVDLANDAGGKDNVTVVVYEHVGAEGGPDRSDSRR